MRHRFTQASKALGSWFKRNRDLLFGWGVTVVLIASILWVVVPDKSGLSELFGFIALLCCMWLLIYWVPRLVWRIPYAGKILVFGFVAFLVVQMYFGIWPGNQFYLQKVERYSGVKVEKPYEIVSKYSTYPDHFGDYTSRALIKYQALNFDSIRENVQELDICRPPPEEFKFSMTDVKCWEMKGKGEVFYMINARSLQLLYYEYSSS